MSDTPAWVNDPKYDLPSQKQADVERVEFKSKVLGFKKDETK